MREKSASEFIDWAIARLVERKRQVTVPRGQLIELLARTDRPLTAYGFQNLLEAQGVRMVATTLYRVLGDLERWGIAHRVASSGGMLRCRLPDQPGCHHHVRCRLCGRVDEVLCPGIASLEPGVEDQTQYAVEQHLVEFVGRCPDCR